MYKDILFYGIPIVLSLVVGKIYLDYNSTKSLYDKWKAHNSASGALKGKNVLVVGGTQGIGKGVAIRSAQLGASVVIAARNEKLAKSVIERMENEKLNSDQSFKFIPVDASLMSDLHRFVKDCKEYFEPKGGIDHIWMSNGVAPSPFRVNRTKEGNDDFWMITAYSKYFITEHLAPILKGSCSYILRPATGGFDTSKIEFNQDVSVFKRGQFALMFTDAIAVDFQRRYPNLKFWHLFPGPVESNLGKNNNIPFIIRAPLDFYVYLVGRDPVTYADHPIYVATNPSSVGGKRILETNKDVPSNRFLDDTKNLDAIRKWSKEFEEKYLEKNS